MEQKTKQFLKSLIGWILYVGFLFGLVFGVPKALSLLLKTDYPMASITSGSMWPVLKKGDLILIKGIVSKEEIEIDDIVVFKNEKGFTIHRVIQLDEDTLITKGDANNVKDKPVRYEDVIGKLLTFNKKAIRIPFLGMVSVYINKNKI